MDKIVLAATQKYLAISRLKGIRPRQMRQLFRAVVVPTTDYAASTWFARGRLGTKKVTSQLEKIQKMGAQAITGAFRTVATTILEAEAALEPVEHRLAKRTAKHLLDLQSVPQDHPLRPSLDGMKSRGKTNRSLLFDV